MRLTFHIACKSELKFLWAWHVSDKSVRAEMRFSGVMVFQNNGQLSTGPELGGKRSICCKREKRDIVDIVFHALRLSRHIALSRVNFPYIWKVYRCDLRLTKLRCCWALTFWGMDIWRTSWCEWLDARRVRSDW